MKKYCFIITMVIILGIFNTAYANNEIEAIFNKEYKVIYNNEQKSFYNAKGVEVYPVFYEGTNYLPIRAVSSLFNVAIKWDGKNNTIYLGTGDVDTEASKNTSSSKNETNESIVALVNDEIRVIYNKEIQEFHKRVGDYSIKIYPLSYEGTTYLPLRNLTELFDGTIEWDGTNKIIKIDSKDYIIKNTSAIGGLDSEYNFSDEYVYNNGAIYFRVYESSDYYNDYTGQMYHDYKNSSGDRAIAKIDTLSKSAEYQVLFRNDSRGKFYYVDDKFFFSNGMDIYATDSNGKKLVSFEKSRFKNIDVKNHKLEIYKDDGIYVVNTLSLQETKNGELHYEYTLEKIKEDFFDGSQLVFQLYKDEENIYYYYKSNKLIDIYCFDYITTSNTKVVSLNTRYDYDDIDFTSEMQSVDLLGKFEDKLYIYVYFKEGSIGNTSGIICCVDQSGVRKEFLKTLGQYVNCQVKDNLLYLNLSSPAGEENQYLIHMDTITMSIMEGDMPAAEVNNYSEVSDNLFKAYFSDEVKRKLLDDFDMEKVRRRLIDTEYMCGYSGAKITEDTWDETIVDSIYRYNLGSKFVYECNIAVHGWITWRGEYYRAGVVYYLVDTTNGNVSEIYRVNTDINT